MWLLKTKRIRGLDSVKASLCIPSARPQRQPIDNTLKGLQKRVPPKRWTAKKPHWWPPARPRARRRRITMPVAPVIPAPQLQQNRHRRPRRRRPCLARRASCAGTRAAQACPCQEARGLSGNGSTTGLRSHAHRRNNLVRQSETTSASSAINREGLHTSAT